MAYGQDSPIAASPGTRDHRLQMMLFAAVGQRKRQIGELGATLAELWQARLIRDELVDLLGVLRDRTRLDSIPVDPAGVVPIHSHATYGLYEIIAAYGLLASGILREIARAWHGRRSTSRTCSLSR